MAGITARRHFAAACSKRRGGTPCKRRLYFAWLLPQFSRWEALSSYTLHVLQDNEPLGVAWGTYSAANAG
ncbi:hypothetical protein EV294_11314 [Paenibacillus sp. BK033]|nr:hypothetical protein [Paenibacillus sp. BK720]TCM89073.1 hypothetical protein EV294_11314 [Paenibacillus sp. BK033]